MFGKPKKEKKLIEMSEEELEKEMDEVRKIFIFLFGAVLVLMAIALVVSILPYLFSYTIGLNVMIIIVMNLGLTTIISYQTYANRIYLVQILKKMKR